LVPEVVALVVPPPLPPPPLEAVSSPHPPRARAVVITEQTRDKRFMAVDLLKLRTSTDAS